MVLTRQQPAHDAFEWYIFEPLPPQSSSVLEQPLRLGPFATEKECCDLLKSLKEMPRFSHGGLEVHKKRRRREKRYGIKLPVKVCRSANAEKSEPAHTLDISHLGARMAGLREPPSLGEILHIHFGRRSAPFQVVWTGSAGAATDGQVGVECLAPEANIWDLELCDQTDEEALLQEIAVARAVQGKMFPQEVPVLRTLDYDGDCIQAHMLGGDYYDFFDLAPGEVAFVLADISGKGVAAALLMANLQGSLRSQSGTGAGDLPSWLHYVNRHLCEHTDKERYATLFLGCYNDSLRKLRYINCGHNPPLLLRKSGAIERLNPTAPVLGLLQDWGCSVAETNLEAGDILCGYTDGVTEATGKDGDEFGETRLLEALREGPRLTASLLLRHVEQTVEKFRKGEREDDLTLMIACAR